DPKDQKQLDARDKLRLELIQAQLLSATVKYESTKTYEPGSEERKKLLTESAAKYEAIYKEHGRLLAGLYAKMWQGRSLFDLGQARQALACFDEVLAQPDEPEEFRVLKTKALDLALDSWNSEQEKKYDLSIAGGERWLKEVKEVRGREADSPEGLSIRWKTAQ